MPRLGKLVLSGIKFTVDELADKYTGKHLFNIMKSIKKNKAGVDAHLKANPIKGAKTADSLVKKIATAKNKRKNLKLIGEDIDYGPPILDEAGKEIVKPHISVRKKGGKIKYKARGGEAGKGTIFKSDKPLPPMHRGTGPKVSRKDTTKPTKSIKKTTTSKKLLDALAAVNKKIRGRTDKQIENLIKKQKSNKKLVDERFKHHVATRPARVKDTRFVGRSDKVSPKKDVASTHRKISTSRFKKGGTITKRKKGGQVGSGSAFVASLYK
jgi:hypothetical protein